MITIKRYANRKLYDTQAKKYITLNGIAELIQEGADVQIVDHASGEDITAVTLAQIMFEREKKGLGGITGGALKRMLRSSGERLDSLRRVVASGPAFFSQAVNQEIERRIQARLRQGQLTTQEAERISRLLLQGESTSLAEPAFERETIQALLLEQGVPSRQDILQLSAELDALSAQIETLMKEIPPKS